MQQRVDEQFRDEKHPAPGLIARGHRAKFGRFSAITGCALGNKDGNGVGLPERAQTVLQKNRMQSV
jgi:hypothetical protein